MYHSPVSFVWEFTNKCNLNCIHCSSECSIDSNLNELTTDEALELCQQILELGAGRVTLTGGEPLMRPDWATITTCLSQLGLRFSIVTNGTLLNKQMIEKLLIVNPLSVGVSLDGGNAEVHDYIRGKKGAFDKTLKGVKLLREAGIYTTVNTTLQRLNIHHLELIREIVLCYGIGAWKIQMAYPHGRMDKRILITERQFYETTKYILENAKRYKNIFITGGDCFGYYGSLQYQSCWKGCHAGINVIGILSDGTVKGCTALPDEIPAEDNVREKRLLDIWNDPEKFAYNRKFKQEMLDGYCAECMYGEVCRGGCTERAFSLSGNVCNNTYCNYKFEQKGFSSEEQAKIGFNPDETIEIYNSIRPLPEGFNLNCYKK